MTRPVVAVSSLAAVLLAGCGGGDQAAAPIEGAAPAAASTPTSPAPVTTPARKLAPPRVPLCPADAPANGRLTDQGEEVGVIGRSSYTYADSDGAQTFCLAVVKVERASNGVIVTVRAYNRGTSRQPADLSNGYVDVGVAYGPDGVLAERVSSWMEGEPGQTPLDGVVPRGSVRTGEYAFKVPAGRQRIAVSLTLADGDGAATWAGSVTR